MEDLIVRFGPEVAMIVSVAIFLVGCFKLIFKKQLEKVEKGYRKTIYETLSIVIAFALTALWLFIKGECLGEAGFTWAMFGKEGALVYSATKVAYSLYENFKVRDLFEVAVRAVLSVFKKKNDNDGDNDDDNDDNEHKVNVI